MEKRPKGKAGRRRIFRTLAWLVVGLVAFALSVLYHAQLPLTRAIARDNLNAFVSGEMRGTLHMNRIDELGLDRIVVSHVSLLDPEGRRVAVATRVVLRPDVNAALAGILRFRSAHLKGGAVRLIDDGEGMPTLLRAFEAAVPSTSDEPGLHALVDHIELEGLLLHGQILDLEGLRVEDLHATGRLEVYEELEVDVWSATGRIVSPFPFEGQLDKIRGRISTDPAAGMRLRAEAHKGEERARVNIVYAVPEAGGEEELDLLIHADPVRARTVEQLGYEWAELLDGESRGYVRLQGPPDDLRLTAALETEGGPVEVEGSLPAEGTAEIEVRTRGVALAKLVRDAPAIDVAGRGTLLIEPGEDEVKVRIHTKPFQYGTWKVPALTVHGATEEEAFRIDSFEGPYAGGRVRGSGHVGYDSSVDLQIRGHIPQIARDENLREVLPDARGAVEADFQIRMDGGESDRFDFFGTLVLRDFQYGPFTAEWLRLHGHVMGDPEKPTVDLDVDGQGTAMAEYPLGVAEATVEGGPHHYESRARFHAPGDRRVELDAAVEASGETYVLNASNLMLAVGDHVWRGHATNVAYEPDREIRIENVMVASGSQRLEMWGTSRFHGDEDLEAQIQNLDLESLRIIFGDQAPDYEGRVDAHVRLLGDVKDPNLLVEGAVHDGVAYGVHSIDMAYIGTYEDAVLSLDAQADLGAQGSIGMVANGTVDPSSGDARQALMDVVYEVEISTNDLDLAVVRSVLGEGAPEVRGRVTGTLLASDQIYAPRLEGRFTIPALEAPGWPPLETVAAFDYQMGVLNARARANDEEGELAEAETSVQMDLVGITTDARESVASLESVPWRLSARLPGRILGSLPAPIRDRIPASLYDLRASVSATLQGGSLPERGDLRAHLDWTGGTSGLACGADAHPYGSLEAHLRDGQTTTTMTVMMYGEPALEVTAEAPTPVTRWLLAADVPEAPPVTLKAELADLDLDGMPLVCEYAAGPMSGTVQVSDLFGEAPAARAELYSPALRLRRYEATRTQRRMLAVETEPVDTHVEVRMGASEINGEAVMRFLDEGRADLTLSSPITWNGERPTPRFSEDGVVDATLALDAAPLAPVLAWIPGIMDVEGTITGQVRAEGPARSPALTGEVHLEHGFMQILSLGQHLSELQGDVLFRGDHAEIRDLRAHDQDGRLVMNGGLRFDGLTPTGARLVLEPDDFPLRSDGSVLATLSGNLLLSADIGAEGSDAELWVRKLDVRMPEELARSLQELDYHPDIEVVGETTPTEEPENPYRLVVRLRETSPFWVRRRDFSAQVVAALTATYADPILSIEGRMDIHRGFFEVFGKRFDVEGASMLFTGGDEIDPEVNLSAAHELRGRSGQFVRVRVTGRLSRPEVEFLSSIPDCAERSQVIALLVSGRCSGERGIQAGSSDDAGAQAAGFLAGALAGVLTLTTRQELGKHMPIIVIESGDDALRSARLRAGFQADSFIPDFLKPVVRSAYVEGFVSAGGGGGRDSGRAQASVGGRVELQFPRSLVGTGTFTPPDSWSIDLTWEP